MQSSPASAPLIADTTARRGRNRMLLATLAATVVVVAPMQAAAACVVCWMGECWTLPEESCEHAMEVLLPETVCFTIGALSVNPNVDYVQTDTGGTFLMHGGKKIPFASERVAASYRQLGVKYAKADIMDPKVVRAAQAEMTALFRKGPASTASPARLERFTRTTGLKVRAIQHDVRGRSKTAP